MTYFQDKSQLYIESKGIQRFFRHLLKTFGRKCKEVKRLESEAELKGAGVGQLIEHEVNLKIRGDQIHWLEKDSPLHFEQMFHKRINAFIQYLNRSCFLSLNDFEFHYTHYPKGSFYKKHIDQFHNDPSRVLSVVLYLNKDWKESNGGQIVVYPKGKASVSINPTWGRIVCFRSDQLAHEVLVTNKSRYSLTGWLKSVNSDKIIQLIN